MKTKMKKGLLLLIGVILAGILIGTISLLGSPATSAQYTLGKEPLPLRQVTRELDSDRTEALSSCFPKQLTIENKDNSDRISRALEEMGNDQLERIFALKEDAKINEAEIQFENCLKEKGITPQRLVLKSK